LWREVSAALSPIIGPRGATALYQRSLHLTRADHPWLMAADQGLQRPEVLCTLRAAMANQSGARVKAALTAWFGHFRSLLSNLLGPPLAERLLLPTLKNSYFLSP